MEKRRSRRARSRQSWPGDGRHSSVAGTFTDGTPLHDERLDAVTDILLESGAREVLDLGCGAGPLLNRLMAEEQFTRIVGIDTSIRALVQAEGSIGSHAVDGGRISLVHGGFDSPAAQLEGFDAAAMVETIEHIDPDRLSVVERVLFQEWRPDLVVMTTPNRDYNPLLGLEDGERRHPDHRFEWGRRKFREWTAGVAARNGYQVQCGGIGPSDPLRGSPTHLAVFRIGIE